MALYNETNWIDFSFYFLLESSLEKVIKWPDRLQVLISIAKAVHFLHTGIIPGSANNRLKSNSVLLDEHFVAKLSDYGLSIITEEIYKRQVSIGSHLGKLFSQIKEYIPKDPYDPGK